MGFFDLNKIAQMKASARQEKRVTLGEALVALMRRAKEKNLNDCAECKVDYKPEEKPVEEPKAVEETTEVAVEEKPKKSRRKKA